MSIALRPGEMLGLIGPNGAGKTTLFNLLAGSLAPSAGSIRVGGRELSRRGPERRIAHGVARTFQIPRPFAEMTVLENVLAGGQGQSGSGCGRISCAPAGSRPRSGRRRRRRGRCWTSSPCRIWSTSRRGCCPAASASCWSWRGC